MTLVHLPAEAERLITEWLARKALAERFEPEIDKVKRRLIEINTELEAKTFWGAAVSGLIEERYRVASRLAQLEKEE